MGAPRHAWSPLCPQHREPNQPSPQAPSPILGDTQGYRRTGSLLSPGHGATSPPGFNPGSPVLSLQAGMPNCPRHWFPGARAALGGQSTLPQPTLQPLRAPRTAFHLGGQNVGRITKTAAPWRAQRPWTPNAGKGCGWAASPCPASPQHCLSPFPHEGGPAPHSCRAGGQGKARAAAPGKCQALLGLQPWGPRSPWPPPLLCPSPPHQQDQPTGTMPRTPFLQPPARLALDPSKVQCPTDSLHAGNALAFSTSPASTPAKAPQLCPKTAPAPALSPDKGLDLAWWQPRPQGPSCTSWHRPGASAPAAQGEIGTGKRGSQIPALAFLPWPARRQPVRVLGLGSGGVSHGNHPGGSPVNPPPKPGDRQPAELPACPGRQSCPGQRDGADTAVGVSSTRGGLRFPAGRGKRAACCGGLAPAGGPRAAGAAPAALGTAGLILPPPLTPFLAAFNKQAGAIAQQPGGAGVC